MDSYTEMQQLQQRSKELRTIVANLEDIKDWMAKNTGDMQSGLLECVTQLQSSIEQVDAIKDMVDEKATAMEELVYPTDPATEKFFNDRHDARGAAGNQSLYSD